VINQFILHAYSTIQVIKTEGKVQKNKLLNHTKTLRRVFEEETRTLDEKPFSLTPLVETPL